MIKNKLAATMHVRHIRMLALGGVIGTGLFLSSGYTIHQAGPLGAVLAYLLGAVIVYSVMLCLGELAVAMPQTGSFATWASRLINPSVGFVVAIMYWLTWTIALGSEFTAAGLICQHWFPHVPVWCFSLALMIVILGVNLTAVRWFAESEFWLALIKVCAIVFFIGGGLLALLGIITPHHPVSISNYWNNGWLPNGWGGVFTTMLTVNFAFSGTELIGVTAGETANPKVAIPRAIHTTLWRLIIFFVGAIAVMAALIPYKTAGVTSSPFVVVFSNLNIPYAADIMNFVVLTAIISAANSGLYASARMVWTLSQQGNLPRWCAATNHARVPVAGVLLSMSGGILALLSSVYAADSVYLVLVSISGLAVVIVWIVIAWSHLNFERRLTHSERAQLAYATPHPRLTAWFALISSTLSCLLIWFDPSQRVALYYTLPFVALCYGGHYWWHRKQTN